MTVAKEPGHRGEHDISRKTIACGNAGRFRGTRCYSCAFYHYQVHTRPRVQRASGVPHALFGRKIHQRLGRIARRGRERVFSRHCEPTGRANARPMTGSAKQSILSLRGAMDCIVRPAFPTPSLARKPNATPRAPRAARMKSYPKLYQRDCERSEAIHSFCMRRDGLLRAPGIPHALFGAETKCNTSGASRREDEVVSETLS